ncbi:MAG: polysaccharide biosynthesis C-terminal domain-containing protein [Acidobacteria bacterium]|nr:polysaccharide biosynthesis C-terminal domain-containing protein [Acidobacteriota bacterium]
MSLARDSISVFIVRITVIILSIACSIIVTRILGPSQRGAMEILLLMPALLVNFGNLGIGNANLHFAGKKLYSLDDIVSNSSHISIFMGLILMVMAYAFFYANSSHLFLGIPSYYAHLVFAVIPLMLFQKFIQYTLLGKEDIKSRNALVLFPSLAYLAATLILAVALKMRLPGVLTAILISNALATLLCLYFIKNKASIRLRFNFTLLRNSITFGIVPFLVLVVMNLNFRIDVFLLRYFWNNAVVGYYSVAVSVAEKCWLLPEAVGLVLFARVSNTSVAEANRITPLLCRFNFLITTAGSILLALFANRLIPLAFGDEFIPSVRPMLYLIPGIIAMTIYLILHSDLTGRGKAIITLYIYIGSLVLNVVMNLILIPILGAEGAAISSAISYSVGAIILAWTFSSRYSIPLKELFLPQSGDFRNYVMPIFPQIRLMLSSKR